MAPLNVTPLPAEWVLWARRLKDELEKYKEMCQKILLRDEELESRLAQSNAEIQGLQLRVVELQDESSRLKADLSNVNSELCQTNERATNLSLENFGICEDNCKLKDKISQLEEAASTNGTYFWCLFCLFRRNSESFKTVLEKSKLEIHFGSMIHTCNKMLTRVSPNNVESPAAIFACSQPSSPYPSDATTVTATTSCCLPKPRHYLHKLEQGARSLKEYLKIGLSRQVEQERADVDEFVGGLASEEQKSEMLEILKEGEWSWKNAQQALQKVAAKEELTQPCNTSMPKRKKRSAADFGM